MKGPLVDWLNKKPGAGPSLRPMQSLLSDFRFTGGSLSEEREKPFDLALVTEGNELDASNVLSMAFFSSGESGACKIETTNIAMQYLAALGGVFQICIWGGDCQLCLRGKKGVFDGDNGGDQSEFGLEMEAWETHLKVGTLAVDSQYKKLQGGGNEQGGELVVGDGGVYKKFGKEQLLSKGIQVVVGDLGAKHSSFFSVFLSAFLYLRKLQHYASQHDRLIRYSTRQFLGSLLSPDFAPSQEAEIAHVACATSL
ncbi:hypothetical protein MA16_Dca013538 [Dendrobium catenatum]|uniref:Uncharacterized protein n=1 Tax=Dendrobium catenatum TaxID=906689 RepID=A0A2I0VPS6_9ASPA|nr:hypothetical protein MA16_Dca013538 [Dendrobium catenatum]